MFTKPSFLRVCLLLLLVAVLAGLVTGMPITAEVQAAGTVLFVKPGGLAGGSCDSWGNACNLQYALTTAGTGDEIWVTAGIYTPTVPSGRAATFQLVSGVALYGGFAGSEANRGDRDWNAHVSVLSGDLDGNDITTPSGVVTATANIKGVNAYNVVTGSDTDATAILDGFTITGGNALGTGLEPYGGGMYLRGGSPTLQHVNFSGNWAAAKGGGMYNESGSPSLVDVTFIGNSAYQGGGMANDNMFHASACAPTLVNVALRNNAADANGGGGGGMIIQDLCSSTLTNVIFTANTGGGCGGIDNESAATVTLTNCTFTRNVVRHYGGALCLSDNTTTTIVNGVMWGDTALAGEIDYDPSIQSDVHITVTYSDVEGGYVGTGNINADPRFMNAAAGDLRLGPGSPAIDSGNSSAPGLAGISTDLGGLPRILGASVDMGAFEFDRSGWKFGFLPIVRR
jgi:hypothetical protein